MNSEQIKELQNYDLEILDYFISICRKLNINYVLLAGSVLGAVRHNGFIPWDDDIDVGVPRVQYIKLKNYLSKEPESKFFFQTYNTDQYYGHGYAKIL